MKEINTDSIREPGFFTIDVEDYYHIIGVSGTPEISRWDSLPSRIEYGLESLYGILDDHKIKATLFFLGYIAGRFPHLPRQAFSLGHEVASHGMYHQEVRHQSRSEFIADAQDSRKLLEDTISAPVLGWRSAGFSVNQSSPWYFDALLESGYVYDSSFVPNRRGHRRLFAADAKPCFVCTASGRIYEFPIGVADLAGIQLSMFGGGYLRFFPKNLVIGMAAKTLQKRPLLIYIHPREMDPHHPRIAMNPFRRFKSYINLHSVPDKLDSMAKLTKFYRLQDYYEEHSNR